MRAHPAQALDTNRANAGTGRVYVVYGNFSAYIGQTVNLDAVRRISRA